MVKVTKDVLNNSTVNISGEQTVYESVLEAFANVKVGDELPEEVTGKIEIDPSKEETIELLAHDGAATLYAVEYELFVAVKYKGSDKVTAFALDEIE